MCGGVGVGGEFGQDIGHIAERADAPQQRKEGAHGDILGPAALEFDHRQHRYPGAGRDLGLGQGHAETVVPETLPEKTDYLCRRLGGEAVIVYHTQYIFKYTLRPIPGDKI